MRPSYHLTGDNVPTVDVLITCCGENLDVILDTVRAACALDYPTERYRVVLLDDGNSPDLKVQTDKLRQSQRNLYYTARGVEVVTHSKAANLNHGLTFVKRLETGPSEYVAVLDVDMIPMPNLLRALVPHLLDDPSFAMATIPQYFYNIPDGDPLCQCLDYAFDVFLLERNTSDTTFCTGSGFVLRRSAVEQIGGFPTDQLSEDFMTSLLLCAKGWKIIYIWEPLQWGLVPETFVACTKQAARWSKGFASLLPVLMDPRSANLSQGHRLQLGFGIVTSIGPAFAITCAMLIVPAVFISGKQFIALETPQQLQKLLMLSALQILAEGLNGLFTGECIGFRELIWQPHRQVFLAPFKAFAVLGFLFPFTQNFTPTGYALDRQRELEARASTLSIRRLKVLLGTFWFQLFVLVSNVFGATICVRTALGLDINSPYQRQKLFVGAAWPPAFAYWMMFIVECWKSISYATFPQKTQLREALLNRDPDTQLAYPSDMAKDGGRIRPSQVFPLVILAYAAFILAYSWGIRFE